MHSRSIRFRLTLWYSIVLTLGLALLGTFIWVAMRHQLNAEIENALQSRTLALEAFLREETLDSSSNLHDEISEFARALPSEYAIEVSTAEGAILFATDHTRRLFPNPHDSHWEAADQWLHIRSGGKSYCILKHSVVINNRRFHLLFADDVGRVYEVLRQLGTLLFIAIPGVVLIAAVGGYLLSARALAPVDAMTRTARSFGIENLSERLRVPDTDDEIQRLAETWNDMLARLEASVTRISQFTSDASHELRTPITIIRATAEIALRRVRSEMQYQQSLHQIEAESGRMTQLVEDLLFLARADAHAVFANMTSVDLRKVIDEVCAEMSPLTEAKGVALLSHNSDEQLILNGRESALRRMLLVLLDNALKYTPEGGTIAINAARINGEVRVSVRDTGIGIAEAALPHIFERFYREDVSRSRNSGGHGLGLSIAQTIARQHNGVILVESSTHSGSEFRVVLPASAACQASRESGTFMGSIVVWLSRARTSDR